MLMHPLHPCICQIEHTGAWFGKSECLCCCYLQAHPLHPRICQIKHTGAWFGKSECPCHCSLQAHPLHPCICQIEHPGAQFGKSESPCHRPLQAHPLHPHICQIEHPGASGKWAFSYSVLFYLFTFFLPFSFFCFSNKSHWRWKREFKYAKGKLFHSLVLFDLFIF